MIKLKLRERTVVQINLNMIFIREILNRKHILHFNLIQE